MELTIFFKIPLYRDDGIESMFTKMRGLIMASPQSIP